MNNQWRDPINDPPKLNVPILGLDCHGNYIIMRRNKRFFCLNGSPPNLPEQEEVVYIQCWAELPQMPKEEHYD